MWVLSRELCVRDEIAGEPGDRLDVAVAETVGGRRRPALRERLCERHLDAFFAVGTSSAIATFLSASRSANRGGGQRERLGHPFDQAGQPVG
jgi:hypothetical protein